MIHPHTELKFISEEVGYGVVATERIPMGTVTWVLDELDQRLDPERLRQISFRSVRLSEALERYGYPDWDGNIILCWDIARFINHSCEPSCVSGEYQEFEVAGRDILPGEQITDDYGEYSVLDSFDCRCGSEACRGRVRAVDGRATVMPASRRDQTSRALAMARQVEQPLWPLLLRYRPQLDTFFAGEAVV